MSSSISVKFLALLAMTALFAWQPAAGQRPGPAPSPAPAPSPGAGSIPNPNPNPNPNIPNNRTTIPDNTRNTIPQMPRPIFLSGKVMLDDGTPPPEPVVIELVCSGNPRPQGYTSVKGSFSIQLGQNNDPVQDASYSGNQGRFGDPSTSPGMGPGGGPGGPGGGFPGGGGLGSESRLLMGCELQARMPGFRSDVVELSNRHSLDNPDVGTIILHRLANVEGTTISATTLQAPKNARKAYDKGREAMRKNKAADAEKQFQKAVDEYPKFAAAWYGLGAAQEAQKQPDAAQKSYQQAIAADPKYLSPYVPLSFLLGRQNQWQGVLDNTDRVLKLDPVDYPQAYFLNAVANFNLHKMDAAEKSAREAVKLDPLHRNPRASQVLGMILADKQDYTGAAAQLRDYLQFAPTAQDADKVRSQLAELDKLSKK